MDNIPEAFDDQFLTWFRTRMEAAWASLPARSYEEILAQHVEWQVGGSNWQPGTRWLDGMSDQDIADVERGWSLAFPPDYRLFLQRLHSLDRPMLHAGYLAQNEQSEANPGLLAVAYVERYHQYMTLEEAPSFYNWLTDTTAIGDQFAWLWEGLQFDVEHNDLWPPSWGEKPVTLEAQKERVRELVQAAPRLIPVFRHRYLLAEPCVAGNPVLSIYQSDIIVYGPDLRSYLLMEFARMLGLDAQHIEVTTQESIQARWPEYAAIPFWSEIMAG